jgi:hypothetical protein
MFAEECIPFEVESDTAMDMAEVHIVQVVVGIPVADTVQVEADTA